MAIAFVRDTGRGTTGGANSLELSFAALPSAGNSVITAVACWDGGTANVPAVTDNQGNTHARDVQQLGGGATAGVHSAHNIGSPSGTFTVTVDPDGTGDAIEAIAAEFSGLATAATLDQTGAASGTDTAPTVTTGGATTQADELVVGCMQVDVNSTDVGIDADGTFTTLLLNQNAAATIAHYSAYKIVTATGAQTFSGGTIVDGVNGWSAVVATYKAAAGGGESAIAGSASLTFTPSGAVTGAGALSGAAGIDFTPSGDLNGAGAMSGSAAVAFTPTGAVKGAGALSGGATVSFTGSAALKGAGAMAAGATITFTVTGALEQPGEQEISGTATITFTASGDLDGSGAMSGTAEIDFTPSGDLDGAGALAGDAALAFAPSGDLKGAGALSGDAALDLVASGMLSGAGALIGGSTLSFVVDGNLIDAAATPVEVRIVLGHDGIRIDIGHEAIMLAGQALLALNTGLLQ